MTLALIKTSISQEEEDAGVCTSRAHSAFDSSKFTVLKDMPN